jgi:hypothetical protein
VIPLTPTAQASPTTIATKAQAAGAVALPARTNPQKEPLAAPIPSPIGPLPEERKSLENVPPLPEVPGVDTYTASLEVPSPKPSSA